MKTTALTIICVLTIASAAAAYDLPEVIGILRGLPPDTLNFGKEFCCVGDQNGDGYDDLLVRHDPRILGQEALNQVKLYYGGEEMDNEPDVIFETDLDEAYGYDMCYPGDLTGEGTKWIAFTSITYQNARAYSGMLYLFEGGEELDTEPEFVMSRLWDNNYYPGSGHRSRPADVNGDSYDDLILAQKFDDVHSWIRIFHGGEEFDTIPDQSFLIDITDRELPGVDFSSGYDINTDEYDDLIVKGHSNGQKRWRMFLGGSPIDTIPIFDFISDHFDDRITREGFSLLPDVNGDGYDDWVLYYRRGSSERDGYLLFFGGEEPDMEFDLDLEGNRGHMHHFGDVAGGDFNNDDIGDIVSGLSGGFFNDGEIHIYFGSRWITPRADIVINALDDYGYAGLGEFVGAIGDYNGDEIDDFVTVIPQNERRHIRIYILSGNNDWEAEAPLPQPPTSYEVSVETYPNPFNSNLEISFEIPTAALVNIAIHDVSGRKIIDILDDSFNKGRHVINWHENGLSAGIYFVMLQTGGRRVVSKVVYLP